MKFSDLNRPKEEKISQKELKENKPPAEKSTDFPKTQDEKKENQTINDSLKQEKNLSEIIEVKSEKIATRPEEIKFTIQRKEPEKKTDFSDFLKREKELKEKARLLYSRAILILREFYSLLYRPYVEKHSEIKYLVNELYKQLNENPFFLSVLGYLTPSDYLISHSINVSIISMGIALRLNLDEKTVKNIGIAGLLHDTGMKDYVSIIRQEKLLSSSEKRLIQNHVIDTIEKLNRIIDFDYDTKLFVTDAISKHHERYDSSGYLEGIGGDKIDIYSGIMAVADVYEAMSQKRPWRDAYEKPVIMRNFLGDFKKIFHPEAIKGIIAFFSLYPPGSIIRLSSGEIGIVELINPEKLARPIVRVIMNKEFENIESSYIDLTKNPIVQIEGEIKYKDLLKKNPTFLKAWQISWLWLDW